MYDLVITLLGVLFSYGGIAAVIWFLVRWRRRRKEKATRFKTLEHQVSTREEVYWTGDWSYIGGKYKEIKIAGYRAVYCFSYYPKGKYERLSAIDASNRETILKFKDGQYYPGVQMLVDFIRGHFWKSQMKNWILCVIPASSAEKNDRRFRTFCQEVAKETGIANGFSVIRRNVDRLDSRKEKRADTLVGITLDSSALAGRNVLLFDDLTTRGTSFQQLADNLMSAGAKYVVGFFLGKSA